ncbi:MAG TPA: Uma2 family endonuclease [Gammaproteobacteria bacterium]|nr:Uma2 family endonuclease [Gammaproteobacteria bacterium]
MQAREISRLSNEEYLQGELESDVRHEFYDGLVFAMAGAGEKHNIIAGNLFSALRQKSRGTPCRTFIADMKLYIPELNRFYYPDILVTCDPEDDHEYYKQSPCLIVEVLSPATENIDRREKLHAYQDIPSVREYLMVSQEARQMELYRRAGDHWQYFLLDDEADVLTLECIDLNLTMAEVYEDVS